VRGAEVGCALIVPLLRRSITETPRPFVGIRAWAVCAAAE
jgi:hypothetical protein